VKNIIFLNKINRVYLFSKPAWKDGSTASVILILNKTVYSANIGDSKAIICRTKENSQTSSLNQIIELTKEHSASIYEERQRIQKCGGQVRDGRVLGVLEISRSIGDGPFKAYGVTCLPDMRKCQLNPFYKYSILIFIISPKLLK
jgi:integrin-linked kinase-associated serine/threonine phosphatase 2C